MDIEKIREILGIDQNIILNDIKVLEKEVNIYIELEKQEQICPCCHKKVNRVHDYYIQKLKDLDMFDKKTFIVLKKKRYKCICGKVFLEYNNFLNKRQRMTKRVFAEIYNKLSETHSFSSVGRELGLSVNTIIRAFDKIEYPKAKLQKLEVLSIDEFKGNTGGEKYNCIITDPKNKVVLDILPKRHFNYLTEHFLKIKREDRLNVKYFVSDMWKPYKDLSETFFKNSKFVVDKYHWIRQVIWAFENVRKTEQKKFYKMFRIYFKKSKRLLTKRFEFLTDEQKQEVNIMLYKSEDIRIAHSLKEKFLEILDCKDRKEARDNLSKWVLSAQNSNLLAFQKCADTMINWSKGILNSFDVSYTNGFTEGCNNKIKVLKRNAYGYRNFERFRNRILHTFNYGKISINTITL